jgi:hypothetical protein
MVSARKVSPDAKGLGDLRHRPDRADIELVELRDIAEDGGEVARHGGQLCGGEFEVGEVGDVADLVQGDGGGWFLAQRLDLSARFEGFS